MRSFFSFNIFFCFHHFVLLLFFFFLSLLIFFRFLQGWEEYKRHLDDSPTLGLRLPTEKKRKLTDEQIDNLKKLKYHSKTSGKSPENPEVPRE